TAPLACTLLAAWEAPYQDAWLLLTDLPVAAAHPCWYAWRAWIEQGFKAIKSAGLRWQQTRMVKPERLERQWLTLAVTVLWLVAIGAEVERQEAPETVGALPKAQAAAAGPVRGRVQRLLHIGWASSVRGSSSGSRAVRFRWSARYFVNSSTTLACSGRLARFVNWPGSFSLSYSSTVRPGRGLPVS